MTTVNLPKVPGQSDYLTAQDEAIRQGFNCYSKPQAAEYTDFITDKEAVFYYSWKGRILEVRIDLTRSGIPESKTATEPAQSPVKNDPPAVQRVRQREHRVDLLLFDPAKL